MDLKDKNVLVVGLSRSGVAAAKVLREMGARVIANDLKHKDALKDIYEELDGIGIEWALGESPKPYLGRADLIVISPGVPIDSPFVDKAKSMDIEVISEVELASRLCRCPMVAITGTNGRDHYYGPCGEIFKKAQKNTYVVGNIGIPFIGVATKTENPIW